MINQEIYDAIFGEKTNKTPASGIVCPHCTNSRRTQGFFSLPCNCVDGKLSVDTVWNMREAAMEHLNTVRQINYFGAKSRNNKVS